MLAIASVPALFFLTTGCATYGGAYDRYDRRDDSAYRRRYHTMKSLAHDLDRRAERAAERARETEHHGGRRERRFVNSTQDFARRADSFHRRMDHYDARWDLRDEVSALNREARDVNRDIQDAHVLDRMSRDWQAVLDVLDRMNRVVAGYDADGYRERRGNWRDERDYER
jgi:hypothetical protein